MMTSHASSAAQDRSTHSPTPSAADSEGQLPSMPADPSTVEELLIEELSIDGMCGVY
jgi:mycofactocin precursor